LGTLNFKVVGELCCLTVVFFNIILTVSWVIYKFFNPNSSEADLVLLFHPISTFIYVLFTGGAYLNMVVISAIAYNGHILVFGDKG
jgi:hypothetical protein